MPEPDPMDQRLREYAARWRDTAAPPPAPDAVRLGPGRRRARTWWLAAASAAAVAAVILGGTQLVGDDGNRHPSEPRGTVKPTGTAEGTSAPTAPSGPRDALRRALEADPAVRWEMLLRKPQGHFLCGVNVLGSSPDGHTLYVWLACGDFMVVDGTVPDNWSGSSEPAVVQVAGSSSDLRIEKVTFPRQGSLNADIQRLFPPELVDRVTRGGNIKTSPSVDQLKAEATGTG